MHRQLKAPTLTTAKVAMRDAARVVEMAIVADAVADDAVNAAHAMPRARLAILQKARRPS